MRFSRRIAADIARTDDDHIFADPGLVALGRLQKIKGGDGSFIAGDRKASGFLSPGGDNHKVKVFSELQDVLLPERLLQVDAGNCLFDPIDLGADYFFRNAAFRNHPRYFPA